MEDRLHLGLASDGTRPVSHDDAVAARSLWSPLLGRLMAVLVLVALAIGGVSAAAPGATAAARSSAERSCGGLRAVLVSRLFARGTSCVMARTVAAAAGAGTNARPRGCVKIVSGRLDLTEACTRRHYRCTVSSRWGRDGENIRVRCRYRSHVVRWTAGF